MIRYAMLFAIMFAVVCTADLAQAAMFGRRSGGCPNGQCGLAYAPATPAATATVQAEQKPATPAPAKVEATTDAGQPVVASPSSSNQQVRFARFFSGSRRAR